MYSVISVQINSLPANTKNRESTRSWPNRVRFFNPWADMYAGADIDTVADADKGTDIDIDRDIDIDTDLVACPL